MCDGSARTSRCATTKLEIHEGKTSKDFECAKCHEKFSTKGNLTQHDETVHFKLRKHVCEVCGRAFGQNGHLQLHIRMRHDKVRSARIPATATS